MNLNKPNDRTGYLTVQLSIPFVTYHATDFTDGCDDLVKEFKTRKQFPILEADLMETSPKFKADPTFINGMNAIMDLAENPGMFGIRTDVWNGGDGRPNIKSLIGRVKPKLVLELEPELELLPVITYGSKRTVYDYKAKIYGRVVFIDGKPSRWFKRLFDAANNQLDMWIDRRRLGIVFGSLEEAQNGHQDKAA